MLIYLLGQAILYIKNKIYKSAKNPLSFTNIDGLADDYRDYFIICVITIYVNIPKQLQKKLEL